MRFDGGFLLPAPESEPPLGPCRRARAVPTRPQSVPAHNRPPRKSASGRSGSAGLQRVLRSSHAAKTRTSGEPGTTARQFAGAALRAALEVLDGRRSAKQLCHFADPAVIAALHTLACAGAPGRELGGATLTRVDVMMSESRVGEVCAAYDRGTRHFALAARIVRGRSGWRLTAFRVC
ncbi:Rv3235 family protein [Nocardia sp. NPDC051030]|uniref:Rv3235 family protein n=1 Tax=Nocardia sp. NPDC051030 TaxID=3155162 RepID=UPI00344390EC